MQQLYRFRDAAGQLLYIGISINAAARAAQHKHDKNWWPDVATMTIETHDVDRQAIEAIERDAIKRERPRYNVAHNKLTNDSDGRDGGMLPPWLIDVDAGFGALVALLRRQIGQGEKTDMCQTCGCDVGGVLVHRAKTHGRFQYRCCGSWWETEWSNDLYSWLPPKPRRRYTYESPPKENT